MPTIFDVDSRQFRMRKISRWIFCHIYVTTMFVCWLNCLSLNFDKGESLTDDVFVVVYETRLVSIALKSCLLTLICGNMHTNIDIFLLFLILF